MQRQPNFNSKNQQSKLTCLIHCCDSCCCVLLLLVLVVSCHVLNDMFTSLLCSPIHLSHTYAYVYSLDTYNSILNAYTAPTESAQPQQQQRTQQAAPMKDEVVKKVSNNGDVG